MEKDIIESSYSDWPDPETEPASSPNFLHTAAKLISVVFHPLLIMTYMLMTLLLVNPYQFGGYSIVTQGKLLALVFVSTFAMPAFALVLMRSLGMVASLELEGRQERIGPYIITGIFYLWMFINFKHNQSIPLSLTVVSLGATIGLFTAFFFNNFTKISAHGVGMGGFIGMASINSMYYSFGDFTLHTWLFGPLEFSTTFVVVVAVLLAGIVCSARLLLKAHTPAQVYGGLAAGLASQFIAQWVMG